jgi:hypothetical protein
MFRRTMLSNDCCEVEPSTKPRSSGRPKLHPWLGLALAALLTLVPKCPLCFAAYLSLFGISASVATISYPLLRPLGALMGVLAAGGLIAAYLRMRSRPGSRHAGAR